MNIIQLTTIFFCIVFKFSYSSAAPKKIDDSNDQNIVLLINPIPGDEIGRELRVKFSIEMKNSKNVDESRMKDALQTFSDTYPQSCVVDLKILNKNQQAYLGGSTVLISQADLKSYGISDTANSATIGDNQDLQNIIKLWTKDSKGISFSEVDDKNTEKFINELANQLKSIANKTDCLKKVET
jgi:hypothetical protein